jgi:hypothetical protein
MQPEEGFIGPHGAKVPRETLYRVCGPYPIRGMNVWRVFDVRTKKKMGPDCFTLDEAKFLAYELSIGRVRFFFQGIPFKRSDP